MKKLSSNLRLLFAVIMVVNLIGIGLTGFSQVHWFSYFLPIMLLVSVVFGYCMAHDVSNKLVSLIEDMFRDRRDTSS